MIHLGQHPSPAHTIVHLSDPHFLADGALLFGAVETEKNLGQALAQLERSGIRPEALVFTGDLADLGQPDAYRRLRAIVEPAAERLGAQVIWVMGNHDERADYSRELFDDDGGEAPQDRIYDLGGLRIISLDTTVPGYHHGELTDEQLRWLGGALATPAPHGTIIAMHHPPIPTPLLWAMEMLELEAQDRLAAVVQGTDVRQILGGHLHYSTHSTCAGVPVSVSAATCYTLALTERDRLLSSVDAGQSFALVHVYEDRVVHSTVPVGDEPEITGFSTEHRSTIEAMTPEQRRQMFSAKKSPFNLGERA